MYKIKTYEQMRKYILTMTQTKQKNTIIRRKQSLVHKVPNGVTILSHVTRAMSVWWFYIRLLDSLGVAT